MRQTYSLVGLDCANCGAKIEKAVKSLDYVSSASLNFVSFSLSVETEKAPSEVFEAVKKIVKRIEPDVKVVEDRDHEYFSKHNIEEEESKYGKLKGIVTVFGIVIYAVTVLLGFFIEIPFYLSLSIYILSYLLVGFEIVIKAFKSLFHGLLLDENFLMTIASFGAFAIGEYPEAVAVMLFYRVGEYFQDKMTGRARRSISDLMDIRPDYANVKRDGETIKVSPDTVNIGEEILVKPGELIPLDGIVTEGSSTIDTSSLTGESVPRNVSVNDTVLSGTTNLNGVLLIKVTTSYGESTSSKVLSLVENAANRKANVENFITKFARLYTPIVVILVILLSVLPPLLFRLSFSEWIKRGLLFLVVSCPCALVISIPLSFYSGIGTASKHGILVKGGNYLHALNNISGVVFDKTGTLTKGVFEVNEIIPIDGVSKEKLLEYAAYAEVFSNHPIATSISSKYPSVIDKSKVTEYFEVAGKGISAKYMGEIVLAGNSVLMESNGITFSELETVSTVIYVAVDGKYLGAITVSDTLKTDSLRTIELLKKKGIKNISVLTGDNKEVAEAVGAKLGLSSVFSNLLPQNKVDLIESFIEKKGKGKNIVFVGDGINDAPVIARADIGIAMGALGTDAAIEAADIVLMNDEPSRLVTAIEVAAFTKKIVFQNIYLSLAIKVLCLILGSLGLASMWEAVFADVGVALLAILNAFRIGQRKYRK